MIKAALVLAVHEGRGLLLKRGADAPLQPDDWAVPGGHVDDGEDTIDAGIRELEEETGIVSHDLQFLEHATTKHGMSVAVYKAEVSNKDVRLSYEHTEFGWFTSRDMPEQTGPISIRLLREHCP